MMEILDELTEVPFQIFIDKWIEKRTCIFNREKAEKEWFYMAEKNRVLAFQALCKDHPMIHSAKEPYAFLEYFNLPF